MMISSTRKMRPDRGSSLPARFPAMLLPCARGRRTPLKPPPRSAGGAPTPAARLAGPRARHELRPGLELQRADVIVHRRLGDDAAPLAAEQQRARLGADLAVDGRLCEALAPPRVQPEAGAEVGALYRQHDAGRRPLALGCDKLPLKYCTTQSDPDGRAEPGPAWRRRAPPPVEHPAAAPHSAAAPPGEPRGPRLRTRCPGSASAAYMAAEARGLPA